MAAKKESNKRKDPLSALLSTWQSLAGQLPTGMAQVGDALNAATETVAKAASQASKDVIPAMPGELASAQFNVVAAALAAQRESMRAMQKQLIAFDEQLRMLEKMLRPMVAWSGNWAQMESSIAAPVTNAARAATRAAEDTIAAAQSAAVAAASVVTDRGGAAFVEVVDNPSDAADPEPEPEPEDNEPAPAPRARKTAPRKATPRKATPRKRATKTTARKAAPRTRRAADD